MLQVTAKNRVFEVPHALLQVRAEGADSDREWLQREGGGEQTLRPGHR